MNYIFLTNLIQFFTANPLLIFNCFLCLKLKYKKNLEIILNKFAIGKLRSIFLYHKLFIKIAIFPILLRLSVCTLSFHFKPNVV